MYDLPGNMTYEQLFAWMSERGLNGYAKMYPKTDGSGFVVVNQADHRLPSGVKDSITHLAMVLYDLKHGERVTDYR